ncbi:hypothetical protein BGZ80_005091 [Entomortierella chlamydospora]|uniref:Uncharacterized protein n=1 Tax=Entomortierella chlamydospora TaxID=101097 RepID=A0A9P6MZY4_9FUNG|nr:hypothetical protein BGZ80_005091 [Entomortierella chlamydospora]
MILVLVSLVQASFDLIVIPGGIYRVHSRVGFLFAPVKDDYARVNIDPREEAMGFWEFIPTNNGNYAIRQADSGLFLSPRFPSRPSSIAPVILSTIPEEWRLVQAKDDSGQFYIEWSGSIDGEVFVLDIAPVCVFPRFAGLDFKRESGSNLQWELQVPNAQKFRHRLNRLESQ